MFPVAEHTGCPVVQTVVPVLQALPTGVHTAPGAHPAHFPPEQTWLGPHAVPSGTFPVELQVETPPMQDVVPVWQRLPFGLQARPSVHTKHWELRQVHPSGQGMHEAPHALLSLDVSTHAPRQEVNPGLQVETQVACEQADTSFFDGAAHAAHEPRQQIPLGLALPQAVPSATSPVETQLACPELHEIVPVRQVLPSGEQGAPSRQAEHTPARQTCPIPHGVPLATLPTGMQTGLPDAQSTMPVRHGLSPGLQAAPAAQATHMPFLQT
jgi:hypothetical protein